MAEENAVGAFLEVFDALPPFFHQEDAELAESMRIQFQSVVGTRQEDTDSTVMNNRILSSLWKIVNHVAIQISHEQTPKWRWLVDEIAEELAVHDELHDDKLRLNVAQLQAQIDLSDDRASDSAIAAPLHASASPWTASIRQSSARTLLRFASSMEDATAVDRTHSLNSDGSPHADRSSPLIQLNPTRASRLSSLARAVSAFIQGPAEEKFMCHICFEDAVPISEAIKLSSCGHLYCQSCFKSYLELKINDGNVFPMCFHPIQHSIGSPKACGVAIKDTQIQSVVSAQAWEKFLVFRYNKEHEYGRQCPYCAHSQECDGPERPTCVCQACGKEFCFLHGNAHEDSSCADYELKNADAEALNTATIQQIAKPCPGCKSNVEKNGGCNHMKCTVCQASFCWLCGEVVEDVPVPSHFNPTSGSSCAGLQFDGEDNGPLVRWISMFLIGCAALLYPFAFVLTVLMSVICCCGCGRSAFSQRLNSTLEVLLAVFAILLVIPIGVIALAIGLVVLVFFCLWQLLVGCWKGVTGSIATPPPGEEVHVGELDLEAQR